MATYSVHAASPPAFIAAHQYVSSHRAQFESFDPPVATALPATNGHRANQGSDCGSSSGLGGMKQEGGVSDDSASNHDGGSEDMATCIDVVPVSSKQSAASSGKGSSTGTSPTGPTRTVNSVKTRSSPKRQRTPLHIQATPSTSAAAAGDVLTLAAATSASTASGSVVSLNGSTDYAATVTAAYPAPMSAAYPRLMSGVPNHPPPPLYTMTVSSAGQLVDICQNRPTTNGGPAGAPLHSNGQPSTNGPMSSSTTATTGQNASATSSTTGGRNSASPGDAVPQSQPAGPVSSGPQRTSNDLYVHVQPGETLAIRVGSDIQQISGPATVRMVSQNGHPPSALPLHVPPGHMIQQIVDELGNLRHVILSPETTPTGLIPNGPFGVPMSSTPVPPPPTINPNTPVPPSGTPTPQYGMHPHACIQQAASPPPGVPPFPPPVIAGIPFVGHQVVGVDVDPQHVCSPVYDPTGYHHAYVQVRPSHWSPPPGTTSRSGKFQDAGYGEEHDASQNSQSGASGVEDEETEKIKDMLNRIQSPQVLEAGSREAEISWQELDTSEASAPGGPFPQIDASEFTYEIVLFESKPDGRIFSNYRCTPDQGNQLRLCHLKPDTEYFVRLRALLAERGLLGEPSAPIGFKTKPTHPDKPLPPRLLRCGRSWFQLSWRRPSDNGSRISEFLLEMDEVRDGEREAFREAYKGLLESARVNHLQPNTLYRFRLTASNEYGQSDPSDVLLMQTKGAAPTAPNPPQLLDATPTTLRIAWSKRDTDDHFTLMMEDPRTKYGFLACCANTCETVTTVRDLHRNSEYRFRLLAFNDDGESQPSETVTFCTLPDRPNAPPKPQLKDVVKATSVTLAWDPPKDTGGAEVTSYQLEYAADQTASPNVDPRTWKSVYAGANRGVAVHSLEPGQSYIFRLCACGPAGQSAWSDVLAVSTTPIAPLACSRPELVGRPKSTSIHIRWTPPPTTGGAPITEYEVATTRDSQNSQTVYRGPKTDCQITGVLPGRLFSLRVRAYNRTGPGTWSETLETTTAPGAPDPPTELRLATAPGDRMLTLAWNAPQETNGAPITEYRLIRATRRSISLAVPDEETLAERRASAVSALVETVKMSSSSSDSSSVPATPTGPLAEFGEFSIVHTGAALTAEVKNLTPASDFAFKVLAVNASGVSAPSRELICRTVAGPPSAPAKVSVEAVSMTELDVTWEEPTCNGSALIAYVIELSSDGDRRPLPAIQLPAHISQHLIDDLLPETYYRVRVSATNDVGSGSFATATCSTFSMPPPPPLLECVNVGAQSLKLRWHDAKNPVGDEKFYYYVEKENENGSYSPVFEGDSKSVKVKNLNECTRYQFRVRASSPTGGMGPWSEPVDFSTSRLPPPSVKAAPRVTEVTDGSYQIEWQGIRAPGLQASDKIQYRLQTAMGSSRGSDRPEDWKTVYQGSALSYTLSGQVPGTTFRVRVSSVRLSNDIGTVEETVAPASPFAVINQPATPTKLQRSTDSTATTTDGALCETDEPVEPKLSDGHYAILILVGFSLLALLLAFFAQSFMGGQSAE